MRKTQQGRHSRASLGLLRQDTTASVWASEYLRGKGGLFGLPVVCRRGAKTGRLDWKER